MLVQQKQDSAIITNLIDQSFLQSWNLIQPICSKLESDYYIEYSQYLNKAIAKVAEDSELTGIANDKSSLTILCKTFSLIFADRVLTHQTNLMPNSCQILKQIAMDLKQGATKDDYRLSDDKSLNMLVTDLTINFTDTLSNYIDPIRKNIFISALIESNLSLLSELYAVYNIDKMEVSSATITKIMELFNTVFLRCLLPTGSGSEVFHQMLIYRNNVKEELRAF